MVNGVERQSGCYMARWAVGGGCLDIGSIKRENQQDNNEGLTLDSFWRLGCRGPVMPWPYSVGMGAMEWIKS